MKKSVLASLLLPIFLPVTLVTSACGTKDSSSNGGGGTKTPGDPKEPNTPENPAPGTVSDVAGFFVKLTGDTSDLFSIHKGISTFDEKCKAELGEQINCFVEGEEHKFQSHKISLHYHVPKDMCDYVMLTPFWFVNRETKLQKTTLTTHTDAAGQFGVDTNGDGAIDQGLGCYTKDKAPVCCYGKYQWVKFAWDKAATPPGYGEPTTSEIEVNLDQCLAGPAMLTQPKSYLGTPVGTYEWISGAGKSAVYDIEGTDKTILGSQSIIWNVNFSKSADHLNGTNATGFPWAMKYDSDMDPGTTNVRYLGEPYYRIGCYDAAWETKAEILIQLRDWNTKAAYDARATAPDNYHEEGYETTPFGERPKNDRLNWKDLEMPSPSTTPVSTIPNLEFKLP